MLPFKRAVLTRGISIVSNVKVYKKNEKTLFIIPANHQSFIFLSPSETLQLYLFDEFEISYYNVTFSDLKFIKNRTYYIFDVCKIEKDVFLSKTKDLLSKGVYFSGEEAETLVVVEKKHKEMVIETQNPIYFSEINFLYDNGRRILVRTGFITHSEQNEYSFRHILYLV